jgi:hypothetical protein
MRGPFCTPIHIRGLLFELWREEVFLGEVELIKHATGSARMYGDRVRTSLPEYEERVSRTGDVFNRLLKKGLPSAAVT